MTKPFFPIRDLWKARHRIQPIVGSTALHYSEPLSELTNTPVYLKLEQSHPTGSFKIRGAANKMLSLSAQEQEKGVTTFSTGNHGIAVAYVAKEIGIPCTVCISNRVPKQKVDRLKKLKAEVIVTGNSQDQAALHCKQLEVQSGMTVIPPFDDQAVIAGQGTIGLELMEQCPDLQQAIIPLSGGGLLSGISYALKSIDESIRVTGVSMEKSAVMHESLKTGQPVAMEEEETLADSLLGGIGDPNVHTFAMTRELLDEAILVSEQSIAKGMLYMLDHHKMAVEGAAASGIGFLLKEAKRGKGPIVVIVTGNNVDPAIIEGLIKQR